MKKTTAIFQFTALFMAVLLMLSSCTKDPKDEILNTLEGKWEVESWLFQNTSNPSEWLEFVPSIVENVIIEFEEYESGEGNFEWQYTEVDYDTTTLQGEYECNVKGDEIELTFDDTYYGEKTPFEIYLNGDNLILRGFLFGNSILSAKRK